MTGGRGGDGMTLLFRCLYQVWDERDRHTEQESCGESESRGAVMHVYTSYMQSSPSFIHFADRSCTQ